jgi:AcrR family transcriptional regulator
LKSDAKRKGSDLARKPADQSVNRDEIILAAATVLHRQRYEATTMKDIAAEVNLTAASLYHHFHNKDALLLAVLDSGISRVISLLEPIVQRDQSNVEKLEAMIKVHVVSITQHVAVGAAMIFEMRPLIHLEELTKAYNGEPFLDQLLQTRDRFFERRDHFEHLFRQVIEDGISKGEFRKVDTAIVTKAILGANNWVAVWYREDGRLSGEAIASMLADQFLHALQR